VRGRAFNRWVAAVVVDGRDLAEVLIEAGHGVPYKG
jgi:endonuclease YncB( thermonuclease family)